MIWCLQVLSDQQKEPPAKIHDIEYYLFQEREDVYYVKIKWEFGNFILSFQCSHKILIRMIDH